MMFSKLQRQLPTIHIDESVKMENAWVEALSLDSRDFNANFIHCIAGYIFIFKKVPKSAKGTTQFSCESQRHIYIITACNPLLDRKKESIGIL
ncbi:uncharacterized protein LOC116017219 isoform X2 [Ipomoea triloba]|uniref:uncharacterized protein LOC116017219 isoform X2 n=1 Tax=Ipomoea triloba TaxID=35885 RepID=UPI00125DA953|nr:uncharacterized protein LOC116017219 isoform X2 [Ipomoea triloba]